MTARHPLVALAVVAVAAVLLAGCVLPGPLSPASPTPSQGGSPSASPSAAVADVCPTTAPSGEGTSPVQANGSVRTFRVTVPAGWKFRPARELKAGQALSLVNEGSAAAVHSTFIVDAGPMGESPEDTVKSLRQVQAKFTLAPTITCSVGGEVAVAFGLSGTHPDGEVFKAFEAVLVRGPTQYRIFVEGGTDDVDASIVDARAMLASWTWLS
ncbi:MAG: hypothetical protein QOE92_1007 [Chloroflexota bacterium]|jgi:hypothetical protein|nr:hypothetical protein [Chloroflexota bacterium]